jgi:hypothetical protein
MAYNSFIQILYSTKYGIFTSKALREPLEASRTRFVSVLDFGNLACKLIVIAANHKIELETARPSSPRLRQKFN